MGAQALLDTLRDRGVTLRVVGDRLAYRPKTAVPPALREEMATWKQALIDLLTVAEEAEIEWRVGAMRREAPEPGPMLFLTARDVPRGMGGCLSCGDPLPPARGEMFVVRCLPCACAAQIVTDEHAPGLHHWREAADASSTGTTGGSEDAGHGGAAGPAEC